MSERCRSIYPQDRIGSPWRLRCQIAQILTLYGRLSVDEQLLPAINSPSSKNFSISPFVLRSHRKLTEKKKKGLPHHALMRVRPAIGIDQRGSVAISSTFSLLYTLPPILLVYLNPCTPLVDSLVYQSDIWLT